MNSALDILVNMVYNVGVLLFDILEQCSAVF